MNIPSLPLIPFQVVYAGLAGTLLALIVAAISNRWSPRVFFLVALRLAIGWQFLFEGLYKIQTHYGPGDTRPFSSEIYFRTAPGPIGGFMRKHFDNPAEVISDKVRSSSTISPEHFAKLTLKEQAAACPEAVAEQLNREEEATAGFIKSEAEKQLKNIDPDLAKATTAIAKDEEKALQEASDDDSREKARAKANLDRKKASDLADTKRKAAQTRLENNQSLAQESIVAAKAAYARWIFGVDARNTKMKHINAINCEVMQSAPERLAHIERLRSELKEEEKSLAAGLGNGYNIDSKHLAELRMDLQTAESDLAKDANAFIGELKKELTGKPAADPTPDPRGVRLDTITMWFLVGVGACLMAGLLTRLACLLAAGFLVVTYLAHPAFPWYPTPPNTEGNPLFINKNVIECLALLALACTPSGRWLGLDALLLRPFCRYKGEGNPAQSEAATDVAARR